MYFIIFCSPIERLFGLSTEVHTFHTELLERTTDDVLKVAKIGDLMSLKKFHAKGHSLLSIDATGQTALHLASRIGFKDVVRYLIACAPPIILNMIDNDKLVKICFANEKNIKIYKYACFKYISQFKKEQINTLALRREGYRSKLLRMTRLNAKTLI